jgi:rod shape-determining protein MreD
MGSYVGVALLLLAAVAQATITPHIRILGGAPDVVLLMVVTWAVNASLETSVVWAFIGGIAQDLLSAAPTGASTLGMLPIIFGIHALRGQVVHVGLILVLALVLVGTLLSKLVFALVMGMSGFRVDLLEHFAYVIMPTLAYQIVFVIPVLLVVRRLQRRAPQEGRAVSSRGF